MSENKVIEGITLSSQIDDLDAVHLQFIQEGLSPTDIRSKLMGAYVFYLRDPEKTKSNSGTPAIKKPEQLLIPNILWLEKISSML